MLIFFGILIVVACVLLGFFVLVQNPKGGGLSGTFGGFGNQVMGVRQTTDVLEKGTWILAAAIAILCLTSAMFIGNGTGGSQQKSTIESQGGGIGTPAPAPAAAPFQQGQQQQQQPAAAPQDSSK